MRKAKIVCTLGPSSDSAKVIEEMIRAGMDVARLNFSHGTHTEHRARAQKVRAAAKRVGRHVAILQDVQGPKIRLGKFEGGQLRVHDREVVTLTTRPVLGGRGLIPTPVRCLPRDVKAGDPVLLDDGRVRLRVLAVSGPDVKARVEVGGLLKDMKGLNLPGALVSVPTLTVKDRADLKFGQTLGVDYVALSFVRRPEDILAARKLMVRHTPIIAKIEKPQAVAALSGIAEVSDGVMVARGDLGVEVPLETLPGIQKTIVKTVNKIGGLVIVATEMLESMVNNVRPTRAEVSDVANAILDGADAVMLSGETAAGQHPVEAVRTMARIVSEIEKRAVPRTAVFEQTKDVATGVAAAAVAAADRLNAGLIVAYTESGYTARLISELRPHCRLLALTPHETVVNRVALYWGAEGHRVKRLYSTDAMVQLVKRLCRAHKFTRKGSPIVIVAGVPLNMPGNTNLMSIHRC
ncbi:MAG: pyruvate kinase [Myxococcaceae bacterium]|nr:pyruvate kinase [Myxococcaceae bacterium]